MAGLFGNLPDPAKPAPAAPAGPPAPGSRRAAREAAAREAAQREAAQAAASEPALSETPASVPAASVLPPFEPEGLVPGSPAEEGPAPVVDETAVGGSRGGLDELFETADDHHEVKDERVRKKRRRRGCLIALIVVLAIFGGIAAAGMWVWNTYGDRITEVMGWGEPNDWEPGQAGDPVNITVLEGDTGGAVSATMYEAGVTKTPEALYDYLIRESIAVTFYPGVYELRERMSAAEALEALRDPANKRENSVLLREGLTVDRSVEIIAETMGFPLEDVQAAAEDPSAYGVSADSLEGWVFPAMYTFDPSATPTDVIARMVERTRESLSRAGVSDEDAHEILTIASIIQREARFEADFYRVSRVIQNRLQPGNQETHGYLQMDSTAQYGYGELHDGAAASTQEALDDDNPWNTYVHTGLPKGPIANPGDLAIDAAMHPADGTWLYFVTVNDETGETEFTDTYAEHLRAIEVRQEWCRADEARCP
ncbi:endolytic transglycosylase MltG [Microbacterium sp. NIBRBAC000506063]|uniref:endolytic transglycosylase MltG n=1 Tax=Microbacterium sp. NIBRBAC000506063 TaxID=2734618 RepID=UPI001BB4D50A|nr:endolytic transglycosylase MltG [Microbacterium sp. NIBRBAC000506063]QTV80864.1 endolytic transglycosylase MltG [Microbacterium sp. NIBRBAC000506063]